MPFSPEGHYQRSEHQEYIHQLITEFRAELTKEGYEAPVDTDSVVVLSAPPEKKGYQVVEHTDENLARIDYAINAVLEITAKRLKTTIDEVTPEDVIKHGPQLILNGETEQLPMMREVATDGGFPAEHIVEIDCGRRGVGNTMTQFTVMNNNPALEKSRHWTYVTSGYHVPRVARTALANLQPSTEFDVIGVPYDRVPYDVYRKVRGEVNRIVRYSQAGDIAH